ncbi:MAG: extracellular solute-binding protein [Bdellovibrionales bacterium]
MSKFFLLVLIAFLLPLSAQGAQFSSPLPSLQMTEDLQKFSVLPFFQYVRADAPKYGRLKLGATGTFDSLNPFIVRGQIPYGLRSDTASLVYESLMMRGWDEPFTLYGLLASTVEVADDRSAIIFNINGNARFSDGTPVTADDVLFSYTMLRNNGRPNHRIYYKKVASAEKLSPLRVKFVFLPDEQGVIDREMPLIMGLMPIIPKHDWKKRDFNQTHLSAPIGSGPYTVAAVNVGRSIVYARNPNYWARNELTARGLYNFDTIQVDYYRDDSVSLQAFKAGQYDVRRENDPTKWATAYNFPAVTDKRVRLEKLEHHRPEPAYGFIMNTRRALFANPSFREALQYTFDFDWVNKTLFYGQYKRVDSVFPNSELKASYSPQGRELEILKTYLPVFPMNVVSMPGEPSEASSQEDFRANLLKAEEMLLKAGYTIKDDTLYTPSGEPVAFEILLSDPVEEKVALNWAATLKRLGISARVRTVDSAQYQSRLASFDYDVTANKWVNSLSPGNEQMFFWGSAAADQKGSRNYAGVKDPAVDALASMLSTAKTRDELVATARALDRILMQGSYFIPLYYLGADYVASWTRVGHPERMSLYGNVMESWWSNE